MTLDEKQIAHAVAWAERTLATPAPAQPDAAEIWALAQVLPGERMEDAIARIEAHLGSVAPAQPEGAQEDEPACWVSGKSDGSVNFWKGWRFSPVRTLEADLPLYKRPLRSAEADAPAQPDPLHVANERGEGEVARNAARYRRFFDAGLPITFMGIEYDDKASLDAAIDADLAQERQT